MTDSPVDATTVDAVSDAIVGASACQCGQMRPLSYCEAEAAIAAHIKALTDAGKVIVDAEVVAKAKAWDDLQSDVRAWDNSPAHAYPDVGEHHG